MPLTDFWKYNYDTDNWMDVPAYRRPTPSPDTKRLWFEDAACYSLPAELFEPSFGTASREANIKANEDKFAQARRACMSCPVWHICYQQAKPGDFFYTMRAGLEPAQFTQYKELGTVRYQVNQPKADQDRCSKGHKNWRWYGKKRPRRKCVDCDNENSANQRAKRAMVEG